MYLDSFFLPPFSWLFISSFICRWVLSNSIHSLTICLKCYNISFISTEHEKKKKTSVLCFLPPINQYVSWFPCLYLSSSKIPHSEQFKTFDFHYVNFSKSSYTIFFPGRHLSWIDINSGNSAILYFKAKFKSEILHLLLLWQESYLISLCFNCLALKLYGKKLFSWVDYSGERVLIENVYTKCSPS